MQEIKRMIMLPNNYNMFNIPYDLLMLEKHSLTPCYFDNKNDPSRAEVQCICNESLRHFKDKNQSNMIRCNECHKLSHLKCAGRNAKMKNFLCATCQLI